MNLKSFFAFLFVKLLSFTYRFKYLNRQVIDQIKNKEYDNNYIFSLWHQNLIGGILSEQGRGHAIIVSASKDGELVSNICEKLGHKTVRGSSSKGGSTALKKMIKLLKQGIPGAIAVDGPRGPAKEPKLGIFELAYLTKAVVVPITVVPSHYWSFTKSWDNFRLPVPFTSLYIHYGKPIQVEKISKKENFKDEIIELKRQMKQSESIINSILKTLRRKKKDILT